MSDRILDQLVDAIEAPSDGALLTVTAADGDYGPAWAVAVCSGGPGASPPAIWACALAHNVLADAARRWKFASIACCHYSRPGTVAVFVEVQAQPPHLMIIAAHIYPCALAAIAHTVTSR